MIWISISIIKLCLFSTLSRNERMEITRRLSMSKLFTRNVWFWSLFPRYSRFLIVTNFNSTPFRIDFVQRFCQLFSLLVLFSSASSAQCRLHEIYWVHCNILSRWNRKKRTSRERFVWRFISHMNSEFAYYSTSHTPGWLNGKDRSTTHLYIANK